MIEVPVPMTWAMGAGTSFSSLTEVKSAKGDTSLGWAMAGIETAVEAARRYIIKRPRLTRLLDNANARILMLIAPAGFGKTTLAREWVAERSHVWYRGTPATADVAALAAGFAETISEVIPNAGSRAVNRMRAAGTPEEDVAIIAELFAEDLVDWPSDTWLVFDDYQFAMEAKAPERFVDLLLRNSPLQLLLTSRKRPSWASARRLLYGEIYELGRNELAMDHDEAASVLAHRKDAPAAGLVALAEGWPAVIGLAALADAIDLPEGSLPSALHDYFAEELYQAASSRVQRGLCRLALAPSLGEGIAEFLLSNDTSEVVGEGLRLGFLTARSGGLELHPLLRSFLASKQGELGDSVATEAERLAHHLVEMGQWDDAFHLLARVFSEALLAALLENGLERMLAEARLASLTAWLDLARARNVDLPVVDLANAEIAFHQGARGKSYTLAARAARTLGASHPLLSRAFYLAGVSAHLDSRNEDARWYCDQALASATTMAQRREAVLGQLNASLDLGSTDVDQLLQDLIELDDGSALSEVRIAIARHQVAIRKGTLYDCAEALAAARHVIDRVLEPHARSSFHVVDAVFLAYRGQYSEALTAAMRCESYARDSKVTFIQPYARRVRAVAELGLRHFSRCQRLLDSLDTAASRTDNLFVALEVALIRGRLLIAQGLADRAVRVLAEVPDRFPWEGERGEYLATRALALACAGDNASCHQLTDEARDISETIEVRTINPCVEAIVALQAGSPDAPERAALALRAALETGNVDSFVTAYRGYPQLLAELLEHPDLREPLSAIVDAAHDWALAKTLRPTTPMSRPRANLSPREAEVLGLISQGLTNKEIAKTLYISESTAKVHVLHIFEKLGVHTRTEAALRGLAEQLQDD